MNLRRVSRLIGILLMVLSAAMATSIPWAIACDPISTTVAFVVSVLITLLSGVGMWTWGRDHEGTISRREALLIVAAAWALLGVFGGVPYMIDGALPNPVDAYFEAVSGFTTTGSTVLTNIEGISRALHWWRGMTHWLGGMGIIVLFVAILPKLGVGGKRLFKTEVPGPITEGLLPRIQETSIALWWIYLGLTVVLAVILYLIGPSAAEVKAKGLSPFAQMDWHAAFVHAFGTMATGGFSTLAESVAGFRSPRVEWVLTLFMLLAGMNFTLHFMVLRRQWREALLDHELRLYLTIVGVSTAIVTAAIYKTGDPSQFMVQSHEGVLDSLRCAAFQVVSVVTTTGFSTDDFNRYPPVAGLLLVALMFVGGMAGSTAGGLKVFRFLVMGKAVHRELLKVFRPAVVTKVRINDRAINDDVVHGTLAFIILGTVIFWLASLYMAALGLDLVTATTSVAATLFNVGPGLARVGAIENFAFIPDSGKVVLSLCMLLGRLEFYALLVLLIPAFWRN